MTILRSDRAHSTTSVLGWVEQFVKSKSIQDGEVPVVRVGEQTVLVRWNEDIKSRNRWLQLGWRTTFRSPIKMKSL